jgi:hypothetical protein
VGRHRSDAGIEDIGAQFIPTRSPAVYTVEVDGEAVLLDEASNRLHLLNTMAALLWACFDGISSIEEIVTDLSEAVDAPYDTVLRDTLEVMKGLGQEGLLEGVRPAKAAAGEVDQRATDSVAPSPHANRKPYRFIAEPPNP